VNCDDLDVALENVTFVGFFTSGILILILLNHTSYAFSSKKGAYL